MPIDFNFTNITSGTGILKWSLDPFIDILGPLAMPLIFLLPVLIIWSDVPIHKPLVMSGYMMAVGFICWQLFDAPVAILFQFIAVMSATPIFYWGLFKRGPSD